MSGRYAGKHVVVLSRSGVEIPHRLAASFECLAGPPGDLVQKLDGRGYENLYIDGGATICGFLAALLPLQGGAWR